MTCGDSIGLRVTHVSDPVGFGEHPKITGRAGLNAAGTETRRLILLLAPVDPGIICINLRAEMIVHRSNEAQLPTKNGISLRAKADQISSFKTQNGASGAY